MLKISDGDYVPNGRGGFERVTGDEELLSRALFRLTARRGAFPFMPELGSRLYLLGREKPAERELAARQFAAEALAGETEMSVGEVAVRELEGGAVSVTVGLELGSGAYTLSLTV